MLKPHYKNPKPVKSSKLKLKLRITRKTYETFYFL